MNYLGPFHSRKSRATPFRVTMTAFQSPLRIIFYRSLLSRICSNSSFRFCLVTPTAVLQGLLHTTAETHQISTTENSCQATSMRVRNLSMTHEVYTTGLCFSVEPFCVVWWTVMFLQHLFPCFFPCLHLDSTPGAESDVQTIWLQPPKEWLGKTRIRLDHISICAQSCYFLAVWLFVAICADVCALPLLCFEWAFLGLFVWDV